MNPATPLDSEQLERLARRRAVQRERRRLVLQNDAS